MVAGNDSVTFFPGPGRLFLLLFVCCVTVPTIKYYSASDPEGAAYEGVQSMSYFSDLSLVLIGKKGA